MFDICLSQLKDAPATKTYFKSLVANESTNCLRIYQNDIERLRVYMYEKDNHLSYYIPTKVRKIIKEYLNI